MTLLAAVVVLQSPDCGSVLKIIIHVPHIRSTNMVGLWLSIRMSQRMHCSIPQLNSNDDVSAEPNSCTPTLMNPLMTTLLNLHTCRYQTRDAWLPCFHHAALGSQLFAPSSGTSSWWKQLQSTAWRKQSHSWRKSCEAEKIHVCSGKKLKPGVPGQRSCLGSRVGWTNLHRGCVWYTMGMLQSSEKLWICSILWWSWTKIKPLEVVDCFICYSRAFLDTQGLIMWWNLRLRFMAFKRQMVLSFWGCCAESSVWWAVQRRCSTEKLAWSTRWRFFFSLVWPKVH